MADANSAIARWGSVFKTLYRRLGDSTVVEAASVGMIADWRSRNMARKAAVYVHIPFCRSRCAYCDFNTYAGLEALMPAYVAAVCQEIQKANPGTVDLEELRSLRELGVNRLSLGVQSAHDDELCILDRTHTWKKAVETVEIAQTAGFDNLNLDFIFGLPGQTLARWQETLGAALGLDRGPEHLSLYALSVEEGTPLERRVARGELQAPDEDLAAEMYELAEEVLAQAGFFHYEISNWARKTANCHMTDDKPQGRRPQPETTSEEISTYVCRHNLTYWRNEPWLGVGAGAHSWLDGHRWANVRHPREYIAALERGSEPVAEVETIDRRLEMGETMMLGLRLTARGRLLGNQVFACFV